MTQDKDNTSRLQEWILIEAYHNGENRIKKDSSPREGRSEELSDFCVHRDDIYRRYFKLPPDGLGFGVGTGTSVRRYREVRLKSAVILCEAVRELLRSRLIRFARVPFSRTNHPDLRPVEAGSLFLTEAGVRRAKWLLCGFHGPETGDRLDGRCAA